MSEAKELMNPFRNDVIQEKQLIEAAGNVFLIEYSENKGKKDEGFIQKMKNLYVDFLYICGATQFKTSTKKVIFPTEEEVFKLLSQFQDRHKKLIEDISLIYLKILDLEKINLISQREEKKSHRTSDFAEIIKRLQMDELYELRLERMDNVRNNKKAESPSLKLRELENILDTLKSRLESDLAAGGNSSGISLEEYMKQIDRLKMQCERQLVNSCKEGGIPTRVMTFGAPTRDQYMSILSERAAKLKENPAYAKLFEILDNLKKIDVLAEKLREQLLSSSFEAEDVYAPTHTSH